MSGPFLNIPDETPGYWSPATASVDWCEANYAYTPYIAELWNVVSMIPMLIICIVGNVMAKRYNYGFAFHVIYSLLGLIAIGSAFFHATLLYSGQVMDELPMIWGTIAGLYIAIEREQRVKYWWLAPALLGYSIFFTAAYFLTPDYFWLFLVSYIGGLIATFWLSYLVVSSPRCPKGQVRLVKWGVVVMLFGGVLWLLENLYCPTLRGWHFHAIFHVTCAAGPHLWLCFGAWDRLVHAQGRKATTLGSSYGIVVVVDPEGLKAEKCEDEKR